jgi:hypothetical protein
VLPNGLRFARQGGQERHRRIVPSRTAWARIADSRCSCKFRFVTTWSVALILVAGCRGDSDSVAPSSRTPSPAPILQTANDAAGPGEVGLSDAIADLASFKDTACECPDDICVDAVVKVIVRWSKQNSVRLLHQVPTDIERKQLDDITSELSRCTGYQVLASPPR